MPTQPSCRRKWVGKSIVELFLMVVRLSMSRTLAIFQWLSYAINLREFVFETTVIAARRVGWGLLPAVLVSGRPGAHVAQTLCFPGFNAGPPPGASLEQNLLEFCFPLRCGRLWSLKPLFL